MAESTSEVRVLIPLPFQVAIAQQWVRDVSSTMRLNGYESGLDHIVTEGGVLVGKISGKGLSLCNLDDPTLQSYHAKLRIVFDYLKKYDGAFQKHKLIKHQ